MRFDVAKNLALYWVVASDVTATLGALRSSVILRPLLNFLSEQYKNRVS